MRSLLDITDRVVSVFSITIGWIALLVLCASRVYEVIARQLVDQVSSGLLRFIESQSFVTMVLMALGYAYLRNNHVRVDIFRTRMSPRGQAWLEIAGGVLVVVPFAAIVAGLFFPFVTDTCQSASIVRCLVRSTIPFGLVLLGIAGLVVIARNVMYLAGHEEAPFPQDPPADIPPHEAA